MVDGANGTKLLLVVPHVVQAPRKWLDIVHVQHLAMEAIYVLAKIELLYLALSLTVQILLQMVCIVVLLYSLCLILV